MFTMREEHPDTSTRFVSAISVGNKEFTARADTREESERMVKDLFEDSRHMDFSEALEAMKEGKSATRPGEETYPVAIQIKNNWFYYVSGEPMSPSNEDLLAEDWEVCE